MFRGKLRTEYNYTTKYLTKTCKNCCIVWSAASTQWYVCNLFIFRNNVLLAHLAEGHESLCHGAVSIVRPASTFSFKRLLLKNH